MISAQLRIVTGIKRPYSWGSCRSIQTLLGDRYTGPLAELWFSTNEAAPSPQVALDHSANAAVSSPIELPFMAKILGIGRSLSIQVHPDDQLARHHYQAGEGENGSITSATGKYETLLALEPTELVAGPASPQQIKALLPTPLVADYQQAHANDPTTAFTALIRRIGQAPASYLADFRQRLTHTDQSYALIRHLRRAMEDHPADPHVMTLAAMEHYRLQTGESIHIRPGIAHSYLQGMGLEITSPSENIARLGLTHKPTSERLFTAWLNNAKVEFGNGCCVAGVSLKTSDQFEASRTHHQLLIPLQAHAYIETKGHRVLPGTALLIPAGTTLENAHTKGQIAVVEW